MQPSSLEALVLKQIIATAVSDMEQAIATACNKPKFDWKVLPRMFYNIIEEALLDQLKMDMLLNAGCMRGSRQECADRAGLQGVHPARPAHATASLFRLVDSRERNDSSAVHYTPSSFVLLLTIMELRKAHRTCDRLFIRVVEISQTDAA